MGGRVKRANGYNVDDFVADEEDVSSVTSESEYEGGDTDGSDDDGELTSFRLPTLPVSEQATNRTL